MNPYWLFAIVPVSMIVGFVIGIVIIGIALEPMMKVFADVVSTFNPFDGRR